MPTVLAALAALLTALALGVPTRAPLVLADLAAFGAALGALSHVAVRRIRRRPPPWRTLGVASTLALAAACHLAFAPTGPAVVIVVLDCVRADRLTEEKMPRTWAIARDAVRFTRAHSQSSWTRSSMPSLLSGRYPVEHGLYRMNPPDRIHDDVTLLAELFQRAGWVTGAFVEQAQLDAAFGFSRGFDRYGFHDGKALRINKRFLRWNALFRTVPRFVLLHYIDAHGPYNPWKRFAPKGLPPSRLATFPATKWRATIRGIRTGRIQITERDYQRFAGLYDGEVRQLDAALGNVYAALRDDGTLKNGWLVVTADHGERFGEHGGLEHMFAPNEEVISVPLVVRPPGGIEGRVVDDLVQHVDLAPTLLRAVGIEPVPEMVGRDLAPLLRGEPLAPAPSFAEEWSYATHHASVRMGEWKLLYSDTPKLFDLRTDPGELHDAGPENPEMLARLQGMLAAYFAAADAHRPIAGVDWDAAAASGAVWTPAAPVAGEDVEVSDGTMEALEALGYVDEGDEGGDAQGSDAAAPDPAPSRDP